MTKKDQLSNVRKGDLVTVTFEDRQFDVIVIDPHGLEKNKPSIGFGFRMMDKHGGIPVNTLSQWIEGDPNQGTLRLKTPSGKVFTVFQILGSDNNEYLLTSSSA